MKTYTHIIYENIYTYSYISTLEYKCLSRVEMYVFIIYEYMFSYIIYLSIGHNNIKQVYSYH